MTDLACSHLGLGSPITAQISEVTEETRSVSVRNYSLRNLSSTHRSNCLNGIVLSCGQKECGSRSTSLRVLMPYIIGGNTVTTPSSWPWQVQLIRQGQYRCGATLIDKQWILTAGHCIDGNEHFLETFTVLFGSVTRNTASTIRRISAMFIHPKYSRKYSPSTWSYSDWDFALLKLNEPVMYTEEIMPICLSKKGSHLLTNSICYITGFGLTSFPGTYPSHLQEAKVQLLNRARCSQNYANVVTSNMICAGYDRGQVDSCKSDSGGPLVCLDTAGHWVQHGVTSWGIGCAEPEQPGVYARVSQAEKWMRWILQTA